MPIREGFKKLETIKKNDFVEVEYTGMIKDSKEVFDTTSEKVAKDAGIYDKKMTYGPIVVCVGEGQLLKGLDDMLEGKSIGSYEFDLLPENAFGKRDAKLLKIIPPKVFLKEGLKPVPGLIVSVDDARGVVKTISGGRVIVDFNHPLAGKEVIYSVKVIRFVTDPVEKISSFLNLALNLKKEAFKVEVSGEGAKVILKGKLPKEFADELSSHIVRVTGLKKVDFAFEEPTQGKA